MRTLIGISIALSILLTGCTTAKSGLIIRNQYFQPESDQPKYTLKVYGQADGENESTSYQTNKIEVYSPEKKLIQEISIEEAASWDGEGLGVVIVDMNFDGYPDLAVQHYISAGPNISYLCWLWDPAGKQFISNQELEEIPSPEFNPGNQTILSTVRDSAAVHVENLYRYIDGKPVLVQSVRNEYDTDKEAYKITVSKFVNGKMQVTGQYEEAVE
ncbi:hypothetical protein M3194_29935 [Paenibacillus glycanilyticus]|uniref:XAC2610-related protein n=1 Tax=Paenibacillus glycanilyticus TaxID=126569 RepID=UPI00203E49C2|nr:hypothetical protein [Paenibacillus glycanilyticus]MCM3631521.1 hypothetical protein [Paenibacillus glycanilyticus]